jgi:hypothetical protein
MSRALDLKYDQPILELTDFQVAQSSKLAVGDQGVFVFAVHAMIYLVVFIREFQVSIFYVAFRVMTRFEMRCFGLVS